MSSNESESIPVKELDQTVLKCESLANFVSPLLDEVKVLKSSALHTKDLVNSCLEEKSRVASRNPGQTPSLQDFQSLKKTSQILNQTRSVPLEDLFNPNFLVNCLLEKPNLFSFNFVQSNCGFFCGFSFQLDAKLDPSYSGSAEFLVFSVACFEKSEWTSKMNLLVSCKIQNRTDSNRSIRGAERCFSFKFHST